MSNSRKDKTDGIAECISDVRAYYRITFDSPAANESYEYHSIEINVDRAGAIARTNAFYFDEP